MKKEIELFLDKVNNDKVSKEELDARIRFYQHERLIHLIVTFFTGISAILFLLGSLIILNLYLLILFCITLILFIFYIFHYYFLENSVQKLYKYYYDLL